MLRLLPAVRHCKSLLVQNPLAHAKPSLPHDCPSGLVTSSGQAPLVPVHVSAMSHVADTAGRHTVEFEAKRHEEVQHSALDGSHCAPDLSLHVDESQQAEERPAPGSHSSPGSRIPFPHLLREMTVRPPGVYRHVVLSDVPIAVPGDDHQPTIVN